MDRNASYSEFDDDRNIIFKVFEFCQHRTISSSEDESDFSNNEIRFLFRKEIDDGEKRRSGEDRDEARGVEIRITDGECASTLR